MSWAPFFHPTGDYVVFTTNLKGMSNFELYAVDARGDHEPVRITHRDSLQNLVNKGADLEKLVLSRAVQLHLQNRTLVYGNKTVVFQ